VFGMVRGRGTGIRVDVVEALNEGGIDSRYDFRLELGKEAVLAVEAGFAQSEAEGTALFVGVSSGPCSVSIVLPTFDAPLPFLVGSITPEAGGRIVILLTSFGDPGVTPGSCN